MPHGLWIHAAPFESIFQNRDAQKFKTCSGMMPSQVAAFGNWIMEPFDRCVCCDWICLYHDMSTMSLYDVGNHKPQKYPKINYPQCSHKWVLKNPSPTRALPLAPRSFSRSFSGNKEKAGLDSKSPMDHTGSNTLTIINH